MENFDRQAESIDVGQRLRTLREEKDISIRALARMSGLSANALSMIERGLTSPSVSTLNKLAAALKVPVTAFFRTLPVKEEIVFRKAGERTRVPFLRGIMEGLGGEHFIGKVEAFLLTLENGGNSGPNYIVHSGHELVFCLRGKLEYDVEGKSYLLESGDSLIFSANLKHRWRNSGTSVVNALIVISGFHEEESPAEYHLSILPEENQP
ncbi:helix-turn-helix domain-containing protein [Anaerolinea sp.]|uniref:helix-turn-helix domain-containing protein n=1 Tax=Anaerolinea sp. TaxID=1872519 RepID=UPI00261EF88B|nr:cupin domain-containing protein [uncultured Anaerolinea sp.]